MPEKPTTLPCRAASSPAGLAAAHRNRRRQKRAQPNYGAALRRIAARKTRKYTHNKSPKKPSKKLSFSTKNPDSNQKTSSRQTRNDRSFFDQIPQKEYATNPKKNIMCLFFKVKKSEIRKMTLF